MPGVGKTAAAIAIANQAELRDVCPDGTLWAGLGPRASVAQLLQRWLEALDAPAAGGDPDILSRRVQHAISDRRLLVVIDDVWQLDDAAHLMCGGPNTHYLLTMRDRHLAETLASAGPAALAVPTLDGTASRRLLAELAPHAYALAPDKVDQLADRVSGLPLGLSLIGGYLAEPTHSTFPELAGEAIETLDDVERRISLAGTRLGSDSQASSSIRDTIEMSLVAGSPAVGVDTQGLQRAFYALGAFAPQPADFSKQAAMSVTGANLSTLSILVSRSLITVTADGNLSLHQVVADVAAAGMDSAARKSHHAFYVRPFSLAPTEEISVLPPPETTEQGRWAWRKAGDRDDWWTAFKAFAGWVGKSGNFAWLVERERDEIIAWFPPIDQGEILAQLGRANLQLDNLDRALEQLTLSLQSQFCSSYADWSSRTYNLARTADKLGDVSSALGAYSDLLRVAEQRNDAIIGPGTLNNIGRILAEYGIYDDAQAYFEAARRTAPESSRLMRAIATHNIGRVFVERGIPTAGLPHLLEARDRLSQLHNEHYLAITLHWLGLALLKTNEPAKARSAFAEAAATRRRLGEEAAAIESQALLLHTQSITPG